MDSALKKYRRLLELVRGYGSMLVAFSGGVDSSLLLAAGAQVLSRRNLLAVTAVSETYSDAELRGARRIALRLKVRHKVIHTRELDDPRFSSNPPERCYYCKAELFSRLGAVARRQGLAVVAEASTLSDKGDFRPGARAKRERGVRSPLIEAGMTKEDVRKAGRALGLPTWNKPSAACLASRIPYGTKIRPELLKRIHAAEALLSGLGFRQIRLRHHGDLCRIEVPSEDIERLVAARGRFLDKLRRLGYNYVTVDVQGYRTGSMNEGLSARKKRSFAG